MSEANDVVALAHARAAARLLASERSEERKWGLSPVLSRSVREISLDVVAQLLQGVAAVVAARHLGDLNYTLQVVVAQPLRLDVADEDEHVLVHFESLQYIE